MKRTQELQLQQQKPDEEEELISQEEEMFRFLDELRETGAINMFAASQALCEMYHLSSSEARKVWSKWAKIFSQRHPKQP